MVYKYKEGEAITFTHTSASSFMQKHIEISTTPEEEPFIGYRFGTIDPALYYKILSTDEDLASKFIELDNYYILSEPLTKLEQLEYQALCDSEYGSVLESQGTFKVYAPISSILS